MTLEINNAHERALELRILAETTYGISPEGMIALADHFDLLYEEIEALRSIPEKVEKIGIKWMKRNDILIEGLKKVRKSYAVPSWVTKIIDNTLEEAEKITI